MDPFTLGSGFGLGAVVVGIIFAVLCGSTARTKNRSTRWWGVWGFFTTVIALLVLVCLPAKTGNPNVATTTLPELGTLSDAAR